MGLYFSITNISTWGFFVWMCSCFNPNGTIFRKSGPITEGIFSVFLYQSYSVKIVFPWKQHNSPLKVHSGQLLLWELPTEVFF